MKQAGILLILFCAAASFAQEPKQNVAVYISGGEPAGAKGSHKILGSELAKALTNSGTYSAIDRSEAILKEIEKEHVYQRSGAVSDDMIKALGKRLSVQYLCIAGISEIMGDTYFLEARLVNVETAEVRKIASANSSLKDAKEMARAAEQVARELIAEKSWPAAQYAPPPPAVKVQGHIVVSSTPSGATVEVNGRRMGVTPLTFIPGTQGSITVTVSMSGYETAARDIGYGGGTISLPFTLKKSKAAP